MDGLARSDPVHVMTTRRVTLLGGTGFVGTQLVYRLAERVDEVTVLTRRAQRARMLRVLPNAHAREADVHDPEALAAALAGSDVVINLVGILNESGGSTFARVHDELTAKVVAACRSAGVPRYLHMSALNADAKGGSSEYLRSKGRAEDAVRAADDSLAWTIFRPSVIFGEKDAFFNRFANLLKLMPVFPLAVPESRLAPVWIGDVCRAMITSIDDASAAGATRSLCGPDVFTLRELVEYTGRVAGHERPVIGLPDWAARAQASVMGRVPGKPFSHDNYLSLQTDSVCPEGCPPQPTSVEAIVPGYLGRDDWTGRLQKRRAAARR